MPSISFRARRDLNASAERATESIAKVETARKTPVTESSDCVTPFWIKVAHDHEQDDVGRGERRELAAADDPEHEDDEGVRGNGSKDDVHLVSPTGKMVIERSTWAINALPSYSDTSWACRPTFVGLIWSGEPEGEVPAGGHVPEPES